MRVLVIGPNLPDPGETFHVHAEGCGDVKRSRLYSSPSFNFDKSHPLEYDSVEELVKDIYQDILAEGDEDWHNYIQEFKWFSCVKDLK